MRLLLTFSVFLSCCLSLHAQTVESPTPRRIEDNYAYIDSSGFHFKGELSHDEVKIIEAAAIRIVEEFNSNVAQLWKPWTQEEMEKYTPKEREEFKKGIETSTWKLFIADAKEYYTHETSNYKVYKSNGVYYYQDQYGKPKRAYNPQKDDNGVLRETVEEDIKHLPARIEITSKYRKTSTMREVRKYLNNIKNNHTYSKVVFNAGEVFFPSKLRRDSEGRYVSTLCYYQDFTGYYPDGSFFTDSSYHCITFYAWPIVLETTSEGDAMVIWQIKLGDIRATQDVNNE